MTSNSYQEPVRLFGQTSRRPVSATVQMRTRIAESLVETDEHVTVEPAHSSIAPRARPRSAAVTSNSPQEPVRLFGQTSRRPVSATVQMVCIEPLHHKNPDLIHLQVGPNVVRYSILRVLPRFQSIGPVVCLDDPIDCRLCAIVSEISD